MSPEKPHGIDYSLTAWSGRASGWSASTMLIPSLGRSAAIRRTIATGLPRRGNLARRLLGDRGRGAARERSDPMTTLKVGIASYEGFRAQTLGIFEIQENQ